MKRKVSNSKQRIAVRMRLVAAFVISVLLSFVVGILSNLAATYIAPKFESEPKLIYTALGITFFLSLPITIYLFLKSLPKDDESSNSSMTLATQIPDMPEQVFIGRDASVDEIMAALRDPNRKWIVAIDGMGGIGKTALAAKIAKQCLSERLFDAVVWEKAASRDGVQSQQALEPSLNFEMILNSIAEQLGVRDILKLDFEEKKARIGALLHTQRVLVVLDNLETAGAFGTEVEHQNSLASQLRPLLNPSKAILTSRYRFEGELYRIRLTGLDRTDALRLIRQKAEHDNILRVKEVADEEIEPIISETGGSPLALKLVVGQLDYLDLKLVLEKLREVRLPQGDIDESDYIRFYKFIFLRSWKLLSEDAKKLLISMRRFEAGVGGTRDAVQRVSRLSDDALTSNIEELLRLSFLEVGKSRSLKEQLRYYLHQLTKNFVLSDLL
jgi:hypothetical protein